MKKIGNNAYELTDEEVKILQAESGGRWKPETGETYWFVYSNGLVDDSDWLNFEHDIYHYRQGNCFKSREEAQKYADYLEALATLKEDAEWWVADWIDSGQEKHYVFCSYFGEGNYKIIKGKTTRHQDAGTIYFQSPEKRDQSMKDHKDEWLAVFAHERGER